MALVSVTNVEVLDNPAQFLANFRFEITFECIAPLANGENLPGALPSLALGVPLPFSGRPCPPTLSVPYSVCRPHPKSSHLAVSPPSPPNPIPRSLTL